MDQEYFFCPNPKCKHFHIENNHTKWFRKTGYHHTETFGAVQRYRCMNCKRTFSDQTFSLNYYLKIETDFKKLSKEFNSNSSDCLIARNNKMSFESVRIRRDRMARNSLFFQTYALQGLKIDEDLAADGFESFTQSKYYPVNINILMGHSSLFLYYFTQSHSRRKGRTTDAQKKRMQYEYNDKNFNDCSLKKQFRCLLMYLKGRSKGNQVNLNTDKHPVYKMIIDRFKRSSGLIINHSQTSSKEARTKLNPLFPVNYMDKLFRKDIPNHRDNTIAFAKNDRNMLSRVAVYMVHHNFFKPKKVTSKAKQIEEKHYHNLGLDEKRIEWLKEKYYEKRFFLSKIEMPKYFKEVWLKTTATPFKETGYPYPKFAMN